MKTLYRLSSILLVVTLLLAIQPLDATHATPNRAIWQPAPGTTWQWQLDTPIDTSYNVTMYDIDMFDNSAATVTNLHTQGRKVICYISVGSWEDWRPDAGDFPAEVLGNDYDGWAGEKWLDVGNIAALGPIMEARLDLCAKGFDGVEQDNLDGYEANTGFNITYAEQVAYVQYIANAVQYGSGGVGGVVNIITRRGRDNSLAVEAGAGSFDEYEGVFAATALHKGFDFGGALTAQSVDDYETGGGRTYVNTGTDARTALSINTGYSFAEANRLGLTYTGFTADEDGNPGFINTPDADDYTDKDNYSLHFRYEGRLGGGARQWLARVFFGRDENNWVYPTASNPDGWDDGSTARNQRKSVFITSYS